MNNPFKIKPGEHLTLSEVFNRYLDWTIWNREKNRQARKTGCDKDLYSSYLCCSDHMATSAEYDAFFSYMYHLTLDRQVFAAVGFSQHSMRSFIRNHQIVANHHLVAKFHLISIAEWREYLDRIDE